MKRVLAGVAVCALMISSAVAKKGDDDMPPVQPIKMGDAAMSCQQLAGEADAMQEVLGRNPAEGYDMAGLGTSLAAQGAVYAGAGRAVPGIGQVGGLLAARGQKKKERLMEQQAAAEKRWFYVAGLYQGRNCDAQLAAAANAAAAAPSSDLTMKPIDE